MHVEINSIWGPEQRQLQLRETVTQECIVEHIGLRHQKIDDKVILSLRALSSGKYVSIKVPKNHWLIRSFLEALGFNCTEPVKFDTNDLLNRNVIVDVVPKNSDWLYGYKEVFGFRPVKKQ